MAWKACRSCSAASVSMWADSLARWRLAGWMRLALGLQDPGDRVLGQPVDLELGVQGAELVGDGQVAAGVAQADRGGDVQRPGRPPQGPGPAPRLGPRVEPVDEVPQQAVDQDRVADVGGVPATLDGVKRPAGHRGQGLALGGGGDAVGGLDQQDHGRAGVSPAECPEVGGVLEGGGGGHGQDEGLGVGLQRPADRILDRLAGVRLGEGLLHEEAGELRVVGPPEVLVELGPPLGGVQPLGERMPPSRQGRGQRDQRVDADQTEDPVGVQGGQQGRGRTPTRRAGHHRPLGSGGVQHGQGVGDEFLGAVGVGAGRPVQAAVAAAVEGEDPVVAGEVGDLQLPEAGVDDRPGGQQQHGRLALAEHLVEHLDAVTVDVAVNHRLAGSHRGCLLPPAPGSARRSGAEPPGSAAPGGQSPAAVRPRSP